MTPALGFQGRVNIRSYIITSAVGNYSTGWEDDGRRYFAKKDNNSGFSGSSLSSRLSSKQPVSTVGPGGTRGVINLVALCSALQGGTRP